MTRKRRQAVEGDHPLDHLTEEAAPQAVPTSVRQAVLDRMKRARLRLPRRPEWEDNGEVQEPELPADITTLPPHELGALHGQFANMASYAGAMTALASMEMVDKRRALRTAKAQAHLLAKGHKTQDERRALVDLADEVQALTEQESVAEATQVMLQAVYDGYIVRKEACSREMTRRIDLKDREP